MNAAAPRVEVLVNPGAARGATLRHLLGHKGAPWIAHLDDHFVRAYEGRREGLDARFFVAMDGDTPVANITLWDNGRAGIVGHVFTMESHRGRGLAARLMDALLADADARGVGALALNVEQDSFQQRFYAGRGFAAVDGVAGAMVRGAMERMDTMDGSDDVSTTALCWGDWPGINVLCLGQECSGWRGLGLAGRGSIEFGLLDTAYARGSWEMLARHVRVLRRGGAVVGWVSLIERVEEDGQRVHWLDAHHAPEGAEAALAATSELLREKGSLDVVEPWGARASLLLAESGRAILLKTK